MSRDTERHDSAEEHPKPPPKRRVDDEVLFFFSIGLFYLIYDMVEKSNFGTIHILATLYLLYGVFSGLAERNWRL